MTAGGRDAIPWLDDDAPHEAALAARQLRGLRLLCGTDRRRILDLGCGGGRVTVPLAGAGHAVTGIDREPAAIARCAARLAAEGGEAALAAVDFTRAEGWPAGPFDVVLCLGNTWMTVDDVNVAAAVGRRIAERLAPGGVFVIDDVPGDFWPLVAQGAWPSGLSDEEGGGQLVWSGEDAVFTLRFGDDVDPDAWTIRPGDRRFRMWTDGTLRLLAMVAGLSAPRRLTQAHLLVMRRASGAGLGR